MSYPKPVPAFTPEAFEETLERVAEGTVEEEAKVAVTSLREEMRDEDED